MRKKSATIPLSGRRACFHKLTQGAQRERERATTLSKGRDIGCMEAHLPRFYIVLGYVCSITDHKSQARYVHGAQSGSTEG
jgi:hypothetical protein